MNASITHISRLALRAGFPLLPVALAFAGPVCPVQAQESTAASTLPIATSTQEPQADMQVVTVSANRRREPAREVPMQVDTLSVLELERSGALMLSDYLGNQPGVDVKNGAGAGFGSISIRGVSTGDQTIATVGTYIDDVAYGSSTPFALGSVTSLDMALLDLHHIELLRGPQGTLYGAGAMGGLLKYVTNEPNTGEFFGKATLGISSTHKGEIGHTQSAVVNVPLKQDVAALRISLFHDTIGGYVNAVGGAPGTDVNGGRNVGGRISFLYEPSSRFKARLSVTAQNTRRDSSDYIDYDAATRRPIEGGLMRRAAVREPYVIKTRITAADIEYDFGWARLNAITGHQNNSIDLKLDYTRLYAPLLTPLGLDLDAVTVNQATQVRKWTQELRLTSPAKREYAWLAGFFYNEEKGGNRQLLSSAFLDGGLGPELLVAAIPSQYREIAGYGDLTWNATPRLALTGGVRVARNEQKYAQQSNGLLLGGVPTDIRTESSDTSKTYMATARYSLNTVSNVYIRAASGYRPGGPNAVLHDLLTGQAAPAPLTFAHDSLWSYEVGYKADLLDKRLNIETALYDIRWDDIQQFMAVNGINVIVNAGKAHIQGAELSATYRPSAQWKLEGGLAWVDAQLSEDAPGLGRDGAPLPNTARVSATVGVHYDFQLGGRSAYAGVTQRYVGKRHAGFDGSATLPDYLMSSYAITNLQAGMAFGSVQVGLYVNNLFDRRAQLNAGTAFVPMGAPVNMALQRPRMIGLQVSRAF